MVVAATLGLEELQTTDSYGKLRHTHCNHQTCNGTVQQKASSITHCSNEEHLLHSV